jgi:hypothetical protein
MKKVIFILMLISFLFPLQVRAEEAAPAAKQPAGESKVVVEIPRSQWCQCVRALLGVEGGDIAGCVKSGASEEKLKIFRQAGTGDGRSASVSALLSIAGCSESENKNVGALSLDIQWQGPPAGSSRSPSELSAQHPEQSFAPVTCEAGGISAVEATLYHSSRAKLASAGPWNCSNPIGTLRSIPVDSNVRLVVTGKNAAGTVLYRGEQDGITIDYHQVTTLGTIAAPPFTPVLSAPENAALLGSGRVRFTWAGPPGASSYRIQISDNPGFAPTAVDTSAAIASFETGTSLASGAWFWRVKATDAFNNTGEWSSPGAITVDADPPVNTTAKNFINKGQPATNSNTVSLAISATKKTGVTGYYISERSKKPEAGKAGWVAIPSIATYAADIPYTLSKRDGKKNIYVWFKDALGHVSRVKSGSIIFDTRLPHVTITSHPAHPTNSTSAQFAFTSTKAGSKFQCQLDDGMYSACTGTTSYQGLPDGSHTFTVKASDAAGNVNLAPAIFTWIIDTAPPHTAITSQPPVSTDSASARFDFSSTKTGSTFECRLDGAGYAVCAGPQDYAGLAAGPHTFTVRATDAVGNTDPTPASYTWTIGTLFKTTITDHPPDPSNSANATFGFTSNRAGATFRCQLDNGGYSACASPRAYSGLTEGSHTFSVKAVDAAGNEDSSPALYPWVVSAPARAAGADDISDLFGGLPVPASPEFTMLGLTPAIIRPATPRGLALSYMEGVDVNGDVQDAFAVDMSPYLLLFGKGLSLQQYRDSKGEQDLSRIQLSFSIAKGSSDNDKARRYGAAISWTIWDDGDLRLDKGLSSCLEGAPAPSGAAPGPAENGQAKPPPAGAPVGPRSNICREEGLKRNWNKSAMDVGIAPSWIDRNGKGDSSGWDGLGLWTSLSYGFDKFESLKDNSQIIVHARYRKDEAVPGPVQHAPFSDHDSFSLGARYRYGEPQRTAFLQLLAVQTKPEGQASDRSYIYSAGAELGIRDNLWFELEAGGISGYRNLGAGGFVTVQLKGALPEKATR